MRAVEDLVNSVREAESREYFVEAVSAYQAGAFKSAIVGTWVAVVLDLVDKFRQLADMGEGDAASFVGALDSAIASANVQKLVQLENIVLDTARDQLELIDSRDYEVLSRLRSDRNVCAHPAFVSPEQVFTPSAELCRSHLSAAVDTVLSHGPSPGRKAVDRFVREVQGEAWPAGLAKVTPYVRDTYWSRGKQSMRRNMAIVAVKGTLAPPDADPRVGLRLAEVVHAIDALAPAMAAEALDHVIRRTEANDGLSQSSLLRLAGLIGDLEPTWQALPASSLPRVEAAISGATAQDLTDARIFELGCVEPTIADAALTRIGLLSDSEFKAGIAEQANRHLVPEMLRRITTWTQFEDAGPNMRHIALPLAPYLTLAGLESLLEKIQDTYGVWHCSTMPPLMLELFEATRHIEGALPVWRAASNHLLEVGETSWYRYTGLRDRLDEIEGVAPTP